MIMEKEVVFGKLWLFIFIILFILFYSLMYIGIKLVKLLILYLFI
jgi:hypothetical protein